MEGNASAYQVNPVSRISGEGRAEFLWAWGLVIYTHMLHMLYNTDNTAKYMFPLFNLGHTSFQAISSHFNKFRDISRHFQDISSQFKAFQGISRHFKAFQGIFKTFQGIFKAFQGISRHFKATTSRRGAHVFVFHCLPAPTPFRGTARPSHLSTAAREGWARAGNARP